MGTVDMRDFNVLVLSTIFTLSFVIGQGLEENGFVTDSDNFDTTLINDYYNFVSDDENAREAFIRDPEVFPVCVTDEDCENMTSQHNYRCFMGRNLNMQTEKLWKKSKIRGW